MERGNHGARAGETLRSAQDHAASARRSRTVSRLPSPRASLDIPVSVQISGELPFDVPEDADEDAIADIARSATLNFEQVCAGTRHVIPQRIPIQALPPFAMSSARPSTQEPAAHRKYGRVKGWMRPRPS